MKRIRTTKSAVRKIVGDLSHVMGHISVGKGPVNDIVLDDAVGQIASRFDTVNGGFGNAPKFPFSEVLLFMLQTYEETKNEELWHIVDVTLRHMAAGGFYDQVGGGFHRYSTDAGWKVPHFEKMLNDNALLLMAYLEAYRRSGCAIFPTDGGGDAWLRVRAYGPHAGGLQFQRGRGPARRRRRIFHLDRGGDPEPAGGKGRAVPAGISGSRDG